MDGDLGCKNPRLGQTPTPPNFKRDVCEIWGFGGLSQAGVFARFVFNCASSVLEKVHIGKLREDIPPESIRVAMSNFGTVLDVHTPKDWTPPVAKRLRKPPPP
eukprot:5595600-Amphidinium_carterae.1